MQLVILLFTLFILAGCSTGWLQRPENGPIAPPSGEVPVIPASSPLPTPRQTGFPYYTPLPTPPPGPSPTLPPLPRPPTARSFPPRVTAASASVNIAWGVETSTTLTIWDGIYDDTLTPTVTDAAPLVAWDMRFALDSLAISPDHQSLAVLAHQPLEGEGIARKVLAVIDLNTNAAQLVPSYDQQQFYSTFFYSPLLGVLGWPDNNTFAVEKDGDGAFIATRDGQSYTPLLLAQGGYAIRAALSADGKTFFSSVNRNGYEWWLNDNQGGDPRQISNTSGKEITNPVWSPNSTYISFLSPPGGDWRAMNLWLLNLQTKEQRMIAGSNVWDVNPAWSVDSSSIAFLRADDPNQDNVFYDTPELTDTNLFVTSANIPSSPTQLTSFKEVRNSSLQWTSHSNLILSSTGGTPAGVRSLVAVRSTNGAVVTLISGSSTESMTHPQIFR